jgi:chromosome segregation ATPase
MIISGLSITEIFTLIFSLAAVLIALFKAPAEKRGLLGGAKDSEASATKQYAEIVKMMGEQRAELEKEIEVQNAEIDELKQKQKCSNIRLEQLELEHQAELATIAELKKEIEVYKIANKTLLHENGALKRWAERLVNQIQGLGVEPTPFVVENGASK